jgi:hypothetical protein
LLVQVFAATQVSTRKDTSYNLELSGIAWVACEPRPPTDTSVSSIYLGRVIDKPYRDIEIYTECCPKTHDGAQNLSPLFLTWNPNPRAA